MTKTKLLKICEVVRKHLGLGDLSFQYEFKPDDGHQTSADSLVFFSGWQIKIAFYDQFFTSGLQHQLEVIVHEHLHAMMMPSDQAVIREGRLVPAKQRKSFRNATETGREIAIDHATLPILKLLMPHIKRVL